MSIPTPLPANIGSITEPLLLGYLLQYALFGALSVQVYIYYLVFADDSIRKKLLVYGVYVAELVQAILLAKMAYMQFAADFENFQLLDTIDLLRFGMPILSSMVAAVVQIFYAYKIKIFAESYVVPSVIVVFSFVQLGGGIAAGVFAKKIPIYSQYSVTKTLIASTIWNGSSVVCDIIIAASMTYYLSGHKSGWKPTQRMIQKLLRVIIETGTLTAAIAFINLIMFLLPSKEGYFQTTSAVLGKMYSNTMMIVLNSRMVYGIVNDKMPNELSLVLTNPRIGPVFSSSHRGIPVTYEERTDPLQD